MGYEIEISSAMGRTIEKNKIIEKANRCGCEYHYTHYELEGRRKQIYRQQCIMTFVFSDDGLPIQPFIRYIKGMRGVQIESIINNAEILYASSKYLNLMDKKKAKEYKKSPKD
jgi:hypothetical protein